MVDLHSFPVADPPLEKPVAKPKRVRRTKAQIALEANNSKLLKRKGRLPRKVPSALPASASSSAAVPYAVLASAVAGMSQNEATFFGSMVQVLQGQPKGSRDRLIAALIKVYGHG
jgi:hypothetical protein